MSLALPTEKTPPRLSSATAKVLLYGPPKIGKTTLAGTIHPDTTLILATEAGQGALEHYGVAIPSWDKFRETVGLLQTQDHHYTTVVIDTVDLLYGLCSDAAMKELGVMHPADLDWGKGWKAVIDKFRLAIGVIAAMDLGIWFISHAKDMEIKQRVGSVTKSVPSFPPAARDFVSGFVDHIFYLTSVETPEGEVRAIKTDASEYWEAGSRAVSVRAQQQILLPNETTMGQLVREALEA